MPGSIDADAAVSSRPDGLARFSVRGIRLRDYTQTIARTPVSPAGAAAGGGPGATATGRLITAGNYGRREYGDFAIRIRRTR
jgi:hypothetical protein